MKAIVLTVYKYLSRLLTGCRLTKFRYVSFLNRKICSYLCSGVKENLFNVNGMKMILPQQEAVIGIVGFYEKYITEYFELHIKPGMVVIDIGANIGYYTLLFAKLVGENGRVFAFEPEPKNLDLLEKNINLNGFLNVVFVKKAVSNQTGINKMSLFPNNRSGHKIYKSAGYYQTIEVETIRLDDYSEIFDMKIDFIKMDIEGAEYLALQGMTGLLIRNSNAKIIMEYSPFMLRESGAQPEDPLRLLQNLGFSIYEIGRSIRYASINNLIKTYDCDGERNVMLLCVRNHEK